MIAVQEHLRKRGETLSLIDWSHYPDGYHICLAQTEQNCGITIKTPEASFCAEDVAAVWIRRLRPSKSRATGYDSRAKRFATSESQMIVDAVSLVWPEHSPWISKPALLKAACNKPYNLMMAQQAGFSVPQTAFGNDPEKALDFLQRQNPLAMKTLGTMWMKNNQTDASLDEEGNANVTVFYTKKYTAEELTPQIGALAFCPVILQQYVKKDLEFRVTVVGQQVLACAIHSQEAESNRDDYRVNWAANLKLEPYTLPPDIQQACIKLVRALGLEIGCLDLILTPEGEFFYLEINPLGQWMWVQERTGLTIAESIADLLISKKTKP